MRVPPLKDIYSECNAYYVLIVFLLVEMEMVL